MQISKLQSQRKSLSTPEEPTALDILLITIQVCSLSNFLKHLKFQTHLTEALVKYTKSHLHMQ